MMIVQHYLDFDLLIEPVSSGMRASVINSPVGQASNSFPAMPVLEPGSTGSNAIEIGGQLFAAIFAGEVHSSLRRSIDEAQRQAAGLRIRLRIGDDPSLANVPWEELYDPVRQQFLCLSTFTPVTRYLELPERVQPLEVKPPLRLLVIVASPLDYPPLNVEREWSQLNTALAGMVQQQLITVERLPGADLPTLQQQLRQNSYHMLHFIGHGTFAPDQQEGVLIMGSTTQEGSVVSGRVLGTLLHDHTSLRLVVLNACQGAQTAATNAFAGVAQQCIQQGMPAVIAMQAAIGDTGAITFSQSFYASIGDGYPVDAALAEARKAIYSGGDDLDWAIPVLYMRAPDGILWNMQEEAAAMAQEAGEQPDQPWWEKLPAHVAGDVIVANIGAGASGIAVGKQISQTITNTLGAPQANDQQIIEQKLAQVQTALQAGSSAGLDPNIAMMAKFQLQLLQGELLKLGKDEVPSASTVTQVGNWLLDNVPQLVGALTGLFATPAVGKVVAKAGDVAIAWARQRFGSSDTPA